jgi:hypothetical protein
MVGSSDFIIFPDKFLSFFFGQFFVFLVGIQLNFATYFLFTKFWIGKKKKKKNPTVCSSVLLPPKNY